MELLFSNFDFPSYSSTTMKIVAKRKEHVLNWHSERVELDCLHDAARFWFWLHQQIGLRLRQAVSPHAHASRIWRHYPQVLSLHNHMNPAAMLTSPSFCVTVAVQAPRHRVGGFIAQRGLRGEIWRASRAVLAAARDRSNTMSTWTCLHHYPGNSSCKQYIIIFFVIVVLQKNNKYKYADLDASRLICHCVSLTCTHEAPNTTTEELNGEI